MVGYNAEELLRAALRLTVGSDDSDLEENADLPQLGRRRPARGNSENVIVSAGPEDTKDLPDVSSGTWESRAAYKDIRSPSTQQEKGIEPDWMLADLGDYSIAFEHESLESLEFQDDVESLLSSRYAMTCDGEDTTEMHGIRAVQVRRGKGGIPKNDDGSPLATSRTTTAEHGELHESKHEPVITSTLAIGEGLSGHDTSALNNTLHLTDDSNLEEKLLASLVKTWTPVHGWREDGREQARNVEDVAPRHHLSSSDTRSRTNMSNSVSGKPIYRATGIYNVAPGLLPLPIPAR